MTINTTQANAASGDVEVGFYRCGRTEIILYVNQHGVCTQRLRVPLVPGLLKSDGTLDLEALRRHQQREDLARL